MVPLGIILAAALSAVDYITEHRTPLLKDYSHVHLTYFFLYNFLIGILLTRVGSQGLSQALLFFVPFMLYIAVETLPKEFHLKSTMAKILYAAAPLWGAIASTFFPQIPTFTSLHFPELISIV